MRVAKRYTGNSSTEPRQDRKVDLGDALRRRILTMRIAPGAVLDEGELSEEFGLSKPPVRELLRQLAGEGYVELEPNRPARVAPMGYHALRGFFLAGPMIYIAATRLATERATRADIALLKDIQSRLREATISGDVDERILLNNEFHLQIGLIGRNAYLLPSLRRLLIDNGRIGRSFFREGKDAQCRIEAAMRHHDQIIEAIERQDPDRAESLIREHFDLSRHDIAAYAAPEGLNISLGI